jgi:hypothetical protein
MGLIEVHTMANIFPSMDWFKGTFTGHPYISWENPWFPVDFKLMPGFKQDGSVERQDQDIGPFTNIGSFPSGCLGKILGTLGFEKSWIVPDL